MMPAEAVEIHTRMTRSFGLNKSRKLASVGVNLGGQTLLSPLRDRSGLNINH